MDFKKITDYLDSLIERGIPSVDCIIYKEHEQIYRHMNGKVDDKKEKDISGNEKYLMFSMTKVQTMTAILQLVEQGKISLEDKVSKYLPAYENIMVENDGQIEKSKEPLLLKHLLSMQSGLDYDLNRPGIVRVLKEKGSQASTREIVDSFVESPLKFTPGTNFLYSLSHDVVAAIIEVVSGKRFGEYLSENIWKPLGMTDTFFAKGMNNDVENLASQYILDENGNVKLMDLSCNYQLSDNYESGGAGLVSCTKDYAVFADTIACGGICANGNRILKPETVEIMKTNLLGEKSKSFLESSMGRVGYGYGCGVMIFMEPEKVNSKAPKGVFGWDGAAGSCITMDTASKISVVYTQHVRNCGYAYSEIHPMLRDLVFGK